MKAVAAYPQRQALLLSAKAAGISKHEVEQLLWLIQACPTLENLPRALEGLKRVLWAADRVWPHLLANIQLGFLTPLLDKLIPLIKSIQLPSTPTNGAGFNDWLEDGENVNRNPVYAAFGELPLGFSRYAYRCWMVAAHVFVAQATLLRSNGQSSGKQYFPTQANYEAFDFAEPWDQIRVPARHAGLALRDMCGNSRWEPGLLRSLKLRLLPRDFAQATPMRVRLPRLSKKDCDWLQDRIDYLFNYVSQVYGVKRRFRGHGRVPQNPPNSSANRSTAPSASGQNSSQSTGGGHRARKSGSARKPGESTPQQDWDRFDECPNEDDDYHDDDDNDHETGTDGNGDDEEESGGARGDSGQKSGQREGAGEADGGSYQAVRASKGFAFAADRLAPCELVPLDVDGRAMANHLLDDLMRRSDSVCSRQSDFEQAEALIFILTGLWFGSNCERTRSLLVSTDPDFDFDHDVPLACIMSEEAMGKDARFIVQVQFPKECSVLQNRIGKDRNRTDRVDLPDTAELGPLLWRIAALRGKFTGRQESQDHRTDPFEVFEDSLEHYRKHVIATLAKWNRTGRMTLASISNTLYGSVLSWSGKDIVATTMITGVYKNQARVPMFYSSRRMGALQQIYATAVADLRHRIQLESRHKAGHTIDGSAILLKANLTFLRRLTPSDTFEPAPANTWYVGTRRCPEDHEMQNAVVGVRDDLRKAWDLTKTGDFVAHTNLYTFYTVWFFGFASGCRPVSNPYLGLSEVSPLSHIAALHDKGEEKARLVWIPDSLYTQMQYYAAYLHSTPLYFYAKNPCWFLSEVGNPTVVRPASMEPLLHRYLPGFPTNIHRRWMMNALWESGCPPEVVRAWSGHVTRGNAFWAKGATVYYRQIGETLRRHIEPILNYLSFVPIKRLSQRPTFRKRAK